MTKLQKLNLLKCIKSGYKARLDEIRSLKIIPPDIHEEIIKQDRMLRRAIKDCDHLTLGVMRDRPLNRDSDFTSMKNLNVFELFDN